MVIEYKLNFSHIMITPSLKSLMISTDSRWHLILKTFSKVVDYEAMKFELLLAIVVAFLTTSERFYYKQINYYS